MGSLAYKFKIRCFFVNFIVFFNNLTIVVTVFFINQKWPRPCVDDDYDDQTAPASSPDEKSSLADSDGRVSISHQGICHQLVAHQLHLVMMVMIFRVTLVFISMHKLLDLVDTAHEDCVCLIHLRIRSNRHIVNVNIGKCFPGNNFLVLVRRCSSC